MNELNKVALRDDSARLRELIAECLELDTSDVRKLADAAQKIYWKAEDLAEETDYWQSGKR